MSGKNKGEHEVEIKVSSNDNDEEIELDEAALKKKKIEERRKYLTDTYVKKTKPVIEDRKIIPIINGVPVRKSFDSDDEDEDVGKSSYGREASRDGVYGQVPDKYVKDLTPDERAIIIKNYSDGIKNDNYEVKMLKNGNPSISRKRGGKPRNINDDIIKEAGKVSGRVGNLTTEQFMIKNFIDLENKFTKLKTKQKRLRKKYKKLKGDIYVDDEDDAENVIEIRGANANELAFKRDNVNDEEIVEPVKEPVVEPVEEPIKEQIQDSNRSKISEQSSDAQQYVQQQVYPMRGVVRKMNWRENLILQRNMAMQK